MLFSGSFETPVLNDSSLIKNLSQNNESALFALKIISLINLNRIPHIQEDLNCRLKTIVASGNVSCIYFPFCFLIDFIRIWRKDSVVQYYYIILYYILLIFVLLCYVSVRRKFLIFYYNFNQISNNCYPN